MFKFLIHHLTYFKCCFIVGHDCELTFVDLLRCPLTGTVNTQKFVDIAPRFGWATLTDYDTFFSGTKDMSAIKHMSRLNRLFQPAIDKPKNDQATSSHLTTGVDKRLSVRLVKSPLLLKLAVQPPGPDHNCHSTPA